MGNSIDFKGELKFTRTLPEKQMKKLKSVLKEFPQIDLQLTEDEEALVWNGNKISENMVNKVNFIISKMQSEFSDFTLTGTMEVKEAPDDVWELTISNGVAQRKD